MELREYQKEIINEIRKNLKEKAICVQAACGSGKSIIEGMIASTATKKGNKVLFLVHRKELCEQIRETFIFCGVNMNLCRVGMVQTVVRRLTKEDRPDVIITDECFPKGTLINNIPIEKIKHGDIITSYNHHTKKIEKNKVLNIFKSIPKDIMNIKLINGKEIICTGNHPFYTKRGYIPANKLNKNDVLYSMQKRSRRIKTFKRSKIFLQKEQSSLLFKRVQKRILQKNIIRNNVKNKQEICFRKNEKKQSNVQKRNKRKTIKYFERNWSLSQNKRRQWARINFASIRNVNSFNKIKSFCRIYNPNKNGKIQRLSSSLQNRYRFTRTHDSYRNRWGKSSFSREEITRQKERRFFNWIRLESIKVQEQTSDGTFGGLCKDGYVYNIEVEKNNNYFANGVLVHNCHHSLANSYIKIYNYFKNVIFLGFTATPIRLGGKGLGMIYNRLIIGPSVTWLIENKFLSPFKLYSKRLVDATNLHVRNGDYKNDEVNELMEDNIIYGDTLKNYEEIAKDKKTIIYCSSIEASEKTIDTFLDAGYKACHLDGKTSKSEREKIIQRFRDNKIQILSNVDLFGEGLDVPDCECVILLRPTKSLSLYIQQSMRAMRYKEGKEAVIIDHVGNCYEHGLPSMEYNWTLEDKEVKKSNKTNEKKIKECPKCFAVIEPQKKECPYCQHVFIAETKEKEVEDVMLEEINNTLEIYKRMSFNKIKYLKSLGQIIDFVTVKGYRLGVIYHQLEERGNEIEMKEEDFKRWEKMAGYKRGWHKHQIKKYLGERFAK